MWRGLVQWPGSWDNSRSPCPAPAADVTYFPGQSSRGCPSPEKWGNLLRQVAKIAQSGRFATLSGKLDPLWPLPPSLGLRGGRGWLRAVDVAAWLWRHVHRCSFSTRLARLHPCTHLSSRLFRQLRGGRVAKGSGEGGWRWPMWRRGQCSHRRMDVLEPISFVVLGH